MGLSSQSGDVAESSSLCCQGEREEGAAAGAWLRSGLRACVSDVQ